MNPRQDIAEDEELLPGTTLGKYEILRKLATGGMAEIYLARSRGVAGFEKTVVLKRILPHIAEDEQFVHMFLDEARLAATLQHPNIADVYDVGEVGSTPFFTMEYIHGQDVRSIRWATRKRGEQVPMAMALAIVHGTAAALDYAHGRTGPDGRPLELVHRDVSASNIIVSYDGAIKLLDFGIARASSHQHKTQVGALKGKTPYMSPEQCRAQRIDRRSDLFSLGTVMFELTVGRRPFRGENEFAVMEQIVHGEAPRPSSLVHGYPGELEAMVMRLLAPSVDARYQSAEELLHDLEQFISKHGLWVSARPLGKYMRLLFAERIDAWERAANEGVTLGEHLAETITSESQNSEPFTPQSEQQARLLRLSQEFPAVSLPSRQMDAVQPPDENAFAAPTVLEVPAFAPPEPAVEPVPPAADPPRSMVPDLSSGAVPLEDSGVVVVPALRPSRAPLVIAVLLVLAGAAGVVAYGWPLLFPEPPPSRAKQAPPAGDDPAATQPAKTGPAEGKPAEPVEAKPAEPGAAAAPPAGSEPENESAPADDQSPEGKRPAGTKRVSPKQPAKAPPRVPSAKQPVTPPKEEPWNQDSPFLPPSS